MIVGSIILGLRWIIEFSCGHIVVVIIITYIKVTPPRDQRKSFFFFFIHACALNPIKKTRRWAVAVEYLIIITTIIVIIFDTIYIHNNDIMWLDVNAPGFIGPIHQNIYMCVCVSVAQGLMRDVAAHTH